MSEAPSMFFQLSAEEIRDLLNGEPLAPDAIVRLSTAYDEHTSPAAQAFRDNAPFQNADGVDFDDHPNISRGTHGAYVMAWVWVHNEDAGIEQADGVDLNPNPAFIVDGETRPDGSGELQADGEYAPFRIFSTAHQLHLITAFDTREAAQGLADRLNERSAGR